MTLELGAHSPVILMEDADVDRFIAQAVAAKFRNAGQICIAPTRFFVHEPIHDVVSRRFSEHAAALRVRERPGNLDGHGTAGPCAAAGGYGGAGRGRGARMLTGGSRGPPAGYFWEPTAPCDVSADARLMLEELFGPGAPFSPFKELEEVLARANALQYGLPACAFTSSLAHAHRIKIGLQGGVVGINTFGVTAPEMPFLGTKDSGVVKSGAAKA